jgi:hypothetical protein
LFRVCPGPQVSSLGSQQWHPLRNNNRGDLTVQFRSPHTLALGGAYM